MTDTAVETDYLPIKAEYSGVDREDISNIPKAQFLNFEDHLPTEIIVQEKGEEPKTYYVITRTADITDSFYYTNEFAEGLNKIADYDGRIIMTNLAQQLRNVQLSAVIKATETEVSLELADKPGKKVDIETVLSDNSLTTVKNEIWKDHAVPRILEYFQWLQENNVTITHHSVTIPELDIQFRRIVIGNIQDDEAAWLTEEKIAETLIFAKEKLHIPLDQNEPLTCITVGTLDSPSNWSDIDRTTHLVSIINSRGFAQAEGIAIVFENGRATENDVLVDAQDSREGAAHEILHVTDPYLASYEDRVTLASVEAYAVSISELGCSMQNAVVALRDRGSQADVTQEEVDKIFAKEDHNFVSKIEVYAVAATVFCYIYEQLGPDKFMQFYGLLSGAQDAVPKGDTYTIAPHQEGHDNTAYACYGNIKQTLKVINHNTPDFDPDAFIQTYLQEVNKKVPLSNIKK